MESVDKLKEQYEPRILALLNRMRDILKTDGLTVSTVDDFSDDEYRWDFTAKKYRTQKFEKCVDLSFTITEEKVREGGDGNGIAFLFDIVGYGGEMLGGMAPYNYTDELWIPITEDAAIERRFKLFEDADLDVLPSLVRKAWEK